MSLWQADEVVGDAATASRIGLRWPGLQQSVDLNVVEVIPQERVVLGVGPSRLTLEIETGEIQLTHEGLRSEDEAEGMRSAWRTSLGLLAHAVTKHPQRSRHVRWLTQPARTSPGLSHVYFTEPFAMAQWLTRAGSIGQVGSDLALTLVTGESITGQVVANTPDRDVAFTWKEQKDAYLVFRTFPSPRDPDERLLAIAWSHWDEEPASEAIVRFIGSALGRLAQLLERRGTA
jgi:hypothetical protein